MHKIKNYFVVAKDKNGKDTYIDPYSREAKNYDFMKEHYSDLDKLKQDLQQYLRKGVTDKIPDTNLFNDMKAYGCSDVLICSAYIDMFTPRKKQNPKRNKCTYTEHYYKCLQKFGMIKEFNVPISKINISWFYYPTSNKKKLSTYMDESPNISSLEKTLIRSSRAKKTGSRSMKASTHELIENVPEYLRKYLDLQTNTHF